MKWPADQVEIMRSGFEQFLANCGRTLPEIKEVFKDEPPMRLVYNIENQVWFDLQYDDTHPAYSRGEWDDGKPREPRKRLVRHEPKFVLYPPDCDDSHRATMLKHVAKSVGLIN